MDNQTLESGLGWISSIYRSVVFCREVGPWLPPPIDVAEVPEMDAWVDRCLGGDAPLPAVLRSSFTNIYHMSDESWADLDWCWSTMEAEVEKDVASQGLHIEPTQRVETRLLTMMVYFRVEKDAHPDRAANIRTIAKRTARKILDARRAVARFWDYVDEEQRSVKAVLQPVIETVTLD